MKSNSGHAISRILVGFQDFAIARAIDTCKFLVWVASATIIHFTFLLFLHFGWSPEILHLLDLAEQIPVLISCFIFFLYSLFSFAVECYKSARKESK